MGRVREDGPSPGRSARDPGASSSPGRGRFVGGTSDGDIDGKAEREAPQNAESASKTHWCEEEKRELGWWGRGVALCQPDEAAVAA